MYNKDNWWKPIEIVVLEEIDKPSGNTKKSIWNNNHTDLWGGVIFIVVLILFFVIMIQFL